MAERRLRNLSRRELIEVIYLLQQKEAEQQKKIEQLEQKLAGRMVVLENAGSIAEAMAGLSEIFEVAQRTADDYVASVKLACKTLMPEIANPAETSNPAEAPETGETAQTKAVPAAAQPDKSDEDNTP